MFDGYKIDTTIHIYIYMAMCHLRGALWRFRVKGYSIA